MNKHTLAGDIISSLGASFVSLGKKALTSDLKGRLKGLKEFEFYQQGSYNLSEYRLKELSKLIRSQVNKILN